MASERSDPDYSSDDENYLRELLDGVASDADREQFSYLDEADEFEKFALIREQEVIAYLRGKVPTLDDIDDFVELLEEDSEQVTLVDVQRALSDSIRMYYKAQVSPVVIAPFERMHELLLLVDIIATNSLDETGSYYGDPKRDAQKQILSSRSISIDERQALIAASNHFVFGTGIDTTDIDESVKAFAEIESESNENIRNMQIAANLNVLFTNVVGNKTGVDTDCASFQKLKQYAVLAIMLEDRDLFQASIEQCLDDLDIDYADYEAAFVEVLYLSEDIL